MQRIIDIIGIPLDLGQSLRGVDLGPGALRYAGLASRLEALGCEVRDLGNLQVPVRDAVREERQNHYLPTMVKVCTEAYAAARRAIEQDHVPVFLGGDHSLAIGTVGGVTHQAPAGVIWIDAHGDFNTDETTRTGNIHGMPLAVLLGHGLPDLVNLGRPGAKITARDVVLIGVRNLDPDERRLLLGSGVTVYSMRDIDERGMGAVAGEALKKLAHHDRLHVSLDIDAVDPRFSPGAGTLVPGGLTYREAQLLMEIIADDGRLAALDLVEINPILDERNRTAEMAVALTASLFGQRIL